MKVTAPISVAMLAVTALAMPVDTEQHPIAVEGSGSSAVEAAATPVQTKPSASKAQASAIDSEELTASLKAIFNEQEVPKDGRACFCANGSICCNTGKGLDCTQGLCGI
ncbi:hypothetical protein CGCF415_v014212 [Colletotrichum fructicola]|uniref:Uncharacterized protein n=1 Tax=Colletotrichum fructicola (strain Nara gc5) TaxID=1213859 RepID=A0A7J6ISD7_COLFN|nr:uncharacterized protein CGMCC3_g3275 [Colletotrichum fructicola]KAF4479608.1 hypothetical protein CGGC5_v012703 [Colletotrichum fructicola Nara gc5]KAE9580585.1 hypothetical protein CGMCC3_g3275 [Colletotrichum fructicola]KAF4422574.1 hypothetical protein CFRS1_v001253 [Colletotrichum fructicola]KAF4883511.1 hypothetical protein CGCFRS4_v013546 [Colletotrichum fructicola]KAF4889158.1 hypothetical protein CGCF415_v014212 [Colletotrichum fructicola]